MSSAALPVRRWILCAAGSVALVLATAGASATPAPSAAARAAATPAPVAGSAEWRFEVQLDGKPVGEHRFTLSPLVSSNSNSNGNGNERRLVSVASFDVKLLGITVYRYRHEARERWQGDCLAELDARTDANGKVSTVKAQLDGQSLLVTSPAGTAPLPACSMTFAYWNPAMRRQTQLLNPQTGRLDDPDEAMMKEVERTRPRAHMGYAWRAGTGGRGKRQPLGLALQWWLGQLESPATRRALLERHSGPWGG